MDDAVAQRLIELNQTFYNAFAAPFDNSRLTPQPGFSIVLEHLPERLQSLFDLGCGNGRFGHYLAQHGRLARYLGLDNSAELLKFARTTFESLSQPADFLLGDMSQPEQIDVSDRFDLVVCLSAMQHIPQFDRRRRLMAFMSERVMPGGHLLLGNWQFLNSERQARKVRPWAEIDLDDDAVEPGDYLLTWNRGGSGRRYVCLIDSAQTERLAAETDLTLAYQFLSDGAEGNLNLYSIFKKPE